MVSIAGDVHLLLVIGAKTYLSKLAGFEKVDIVTIDGGYRDEAAVELYFRLEGGSEPFPGPTVCPEEIKFIQNGKAVTKRHDYLPFGEELMAGQGGLAPPYSATPAAPFAKSSLDMSAIAKQDWILRRRATIQAAWGGLPARIRSVGACGQLLHSPSIAMSTFATIQ